MYQEAMEAIHKNMVKRGIHNGNAFTAEMLPERRPDGQVYVVQSIEDLFYLAHWDILAHGACRPSRTIWFASSLGPSCSGPPPLGPLATKSLFLLAPVSLQNQLRRTGKWVTSFWRRASIHIKPRRTCNALIDSKFANFARAEDFLRKLFTSGLMKMARRRSSITEETGTSRISE